MHKVIYRSSCISSHLGASQLKIKVCVKEYSLSHQNKCQGFKVCALYRNKWCVMDMETSSLYQTVVILTKGQKQGIDLKVSVAQV